jgi:isopentenyl-diphosphate delta-isomerase
MTEAGKTSPVKTIIASGGIKNFLDGYYAIGKLKHAAIYAQASPFLKYALQGQEPLDQFIESQIEGLKMAQAYLTVK